MFGEKLISSALKNQSNTLLSRVSKTPTISTNEVCKSIFRKNSVETSDKEDEEDYQQGPKMDSGDSILQKTLTTVLQKRQGQKLWGIQRGVTEQQSAHDHGHL